MRVFMLQFFIVVSLFLLSGCFGTQVPAPVTHYGTEKGAGSAGVHTVMRGDTLYTISKRYNIVMRDIAYANNLRPPFILNTGQRLLLPPPQVYTVRHKDTLYSVSQIFGVSTSELASQNNLLAPYGLRAGQVLKLPSVTRYTTTPKIAVAESVRKGGGVAVPTRPVESEILNEPHHKPQGAASKIKGTADVKGAPASVSHPKPKPNAPVKTRAPKRSSSKFLRPVEGRIISSYGPKADGLHNDGINIKAARGTPVKAAENGVVVYAGSELKGTGNLILVRHADRWMSAYAHLDHISIKRGATIKRGQVIGTVGATGSVDTPQLHFELRRGTNAINPVKYIE